MVTGMTMTMTMIQKEDGGVNDVRCSKEPLRQVMQHQQGADEWLIEASEWATSKVLVGLSHLEAHHPLQMTI
jgi:hypothetical protein